MSTCKHNDHSHILLYVYLFMVWMFSGSKDAQESQARRIERLESQIHVLTTGQP